MPRSGCFPTVREPVIRPTSGKRTLHMNRHSGTLEVCTRVENLLNELSKPTMNSPEEFFATDNLWKIEIPSTCEQIIEHYSGILLLTERNLPRPAIALSRSIHEAYFRFEYLADNEHELRDWTEWQMSHDYRRFRESLQYDTELDAETRRGLKERMRQFEDLLGAPPRKLRNQWKATSEILCNIANNLGDGWDKRLRRLLVQYPSGYVHIRVSGQPPRRWIIDSTEVSVLSAMRRATELCLDKEMLSSQASEQASEVVTMCKNLLEPE